MIEKLLKIRYLMVDRQFQTSSLGARGIFRGLKYKFRYSDWLGHQYSSSVMAVEKVLLQSHTGISETNAKTFEYHPNLPKSSIQRGKASEDCHPRTPRGC